MDDVKVMDELQQLIDKLTHIKESDHYEHGTN